MWGKHLLGNKAKKGTQSAMKAIVPIGKKTNLIAQHRISWFWNLKEAFSMNYLKDKPWVEGRE